jgi:hypothetical protein
VKRIKPLMKGAAVASALLLVAALVCYRAGAFSRFSKPTPATPDESASSDDDVMFSSSKSDIMVQPTGTGIDRILPDDKKQPEIIYSTKSAPIVQPNTIEKVDIAPAPTKPPSDPK